MGVRVILFSIPTKRRRGRSAVSFHSSLFVSAVYFPCPLSFPSSIGIINSYSNALIWGLMLINSEVLEYREATRE